MAKEKSWSGFAITGFVLSFLYFLSILGIIFSALGMKDTANDKKRGKGLAIAGLVLSIISFVIIFVSILWMSVIPLIAPSTTDSTELRTLDNQPTNILDIEQDLNQNMYFSQTFEMYRVAKVYINVTSDGLVNYALLPDYEVENYNLGESYNSYDTSDNILLYQNTYNLESGKYSIVLTNQNKPVKVHITVRAI